MEIQSKKERSAEVKPAARCKKAMHASHSRAGQAAPHIRHGGRGP